MATVKILKKSFNGDDGNPVVYERLGIIGTVGGELHTLELKLESGDMLAAKMLLASEEKLDVNSRPASRGEEVQVTRKSKADDLFNLDEE